LRHPNAFFIACGIVLISCQKRIRPASGGKKPYGKTLIAPRKSIVNLPSYTGDIIPGSAAFVRTSFVEVNVKYPFIRIR